MQKYLSENLVDIFFLLGISSVVILVISALSIGYFIKKIPHDYFLNDKRGISEYKDKNPIFLDNYLGIKEYHWLLLDSGWYFNACASWPRIADDFGWAYVK